MDIKSLRRDPEAVKKHLIENSDGSITIDTACTIHIPERFTAKDLAIIESEVFIVGFFPIIINNEYYTVNNTLAMMRIYPSAIEKIVVENTPYFEFKFEAGDKIFGNKNLVVNNILTYYIYDEFIAKGNFPWYMNYYDVAKIFETASLHAGVNLGNLSILHMIASTTQRNAKDLTQLYRHILMQHSDIVNNPPVAVPFRSVIWNISDTTSKLNGAYFSESINSALNNPSESVELIEELLRT